MRVVPAVLVLVGIGVAPQADLSGQATDDLVTRAVRAYEEVDLDGTVGFLRRWFASDAPRRAPLGQRRRALTYLGAAEVLRGNPNSAASAFERLVELDPRARIDELIFPPEVTRQFQAVRARTKVVSIEGADGETLSAWLFASSPHQVRVALRRPEGDPIRILYTGVIGDSLNVRWDGRDSGGTLVASGWYVFEAFSTPTGRDPQRVLQVPVEVVAQVPDTLPTPPPLPDSLLLPERRGAGPGVEALFGGLVTGLGLVVLPPLVAPDAEVKPVRWVVAGTISLAGLAAFLRHMPGGTVAAHRRANDELRRNWRERVAAVAEQNRARRAEAPVMIRVGQPVVIRLTER